MPLGSTATPCGESSRADVAGPPSPAKVGTEEGRRRWPSDPAKFSYNGQEYDLYRVPIDGQTRTLALTRPGRENSTFVDPNRGSGG